MIRTNKVMQSTHLTSVDMLNDFNLNWTVEKKPAFIEDDGVKVPTDYLMLQRQDTKEIFSTCKAGYEIVQNSQLVDLIFEISQKTGYDMSTGGEFAGGRKVFVQLRSPNTLSNIGKNNDNVFGFLSGINSHDCTHSLMWGECSLVGSCSNRFPIALKNLTNSKNKTKSKIKHTKAAQSLIEQEVLKLHTIVEQEAELFTIFEKLATVPATKVHISEVIMGITQVKLLERERLLSRSELEAQGKFSTQKINQTMLIADNIATEMLQKGNTMWGLLNGVTKYTNYDISEVRKGSGMLEGLYTGRAYNVNNDTFALLLPHVQ